MSETDKKELSIDEQLVRFSVGLEDVDDLILDLQSALSNAVKQ